MYRTTTTIQYYYQVATVGVVPVVLLARSSLSTGSSKTLERMIDKQIRRATVRTLVQFCLLVKIFENFFDY